MRLVILDSGGDCPGLNAVIRAVVRMVTVATSSVSGILYRGGTILGTSRFDPLCIDNDIATTDVTFRCHIAVQIVTGSLTAALHRRVPQPHHDSRNYGTLHGVSGRSTFR